MESPWIMVGRGFRNANQPLIVGDRINLQQALR
jgi:hypothetical protein